MRTLWFVIPAAGRVAMTRLCLKHLRHTCDHLRTHGVEASAVVVADDENLDVAWEFGFHTVDRENTFLSKKYNDGIQMACDPAHNPRPADYAVPLGSDDWVDWRIFLDLPSQDTVMGFKRLSVVRPDGLELSSHQLNNLGGCGIRIYPRDIVAARAFRPGDEDRYRGCDTSIMVNLHKTIDNLKVVHADIDPLQIVDWKSPDTQLTPFEKFRAHKKLGSGDPFQLLQDRYPAALLAEMRDHYTVPVAA